MISSNEGSPSSSASFAAWCLRHNFAWRSDLRTLEATAILLSENGAFEKSVSGAKERGTDGVPSYSACSRKMMSHDGKKKSGEDASADVYALATMILRYVGVQFLDAGLISQPGSPNPLYADRDAIFCDGYLLGIVYGLCKSLERRNQEMKNANMLFETYGLIILKLLGEVQAERAIQASIAMMKAVDQEFLRGTIDGYGEGLAVMSIEDHKFVLLRRLIQLKTAG
jgi:hypothetical protein